MAGLSVGVRDGWGEFLKCLDLYSQDLLQLSEMIQLTTELFYARGLSNELLDAFKKLIQNRSAICTIYEDYTSAPGEGASQTDSRITSEERSSFLWASTPLHEIDFSRCKHGTPSYRALPTSMSRPRCGQRSDLDFAVLNDVWVSQPVGSEGTYSFKHVRKNHYEEELFRCEDERYELDMVIDSNVAAIAMIEAMHTEAQFRSTKMSDGNFKSLAEISAGDSTPLTGFVLDGAVLSITHYNAIGRVYGDHSIH